MKAILLTLLAACVDVPLPNGGEAGQFYICHVTFADQTTTKLTVCAPVDAWRPGHDPVPVYCDGCQTAAIECWATGSLCTYEGDQ